MFLLWSREEKRTAAAKQTRLSMNSERQLAACLRVLGARLFPSVFALFPPAGADIAAMLL